MSRGMRENRVFRPVGGLRGKYGRGTQGGNGRSVSFPAYLLSFGCVCGEAWRTSPGRVAGKGRGCFLFVMPSKCPEASVLERETAFPPSVFPFSVHFPAALQGAFRFFAARKKFLSAKTEISFSKENRILAGKCAYMTVLAPVF